MRPGSLAGSQPGISTKLGVNPVITPLVVNTERTVLRGKNKKRPRDSPARPAGVQACPEKSVCVACLCLGAAPARQLSGFT